MLKIHNFYTDLLLSIRYLFDTIALGPGSIKHYEFNIGNKTLQLNYESQHELPSCIINYQTSNVSKYHPWLIKRTSLGNHSRFPILYNNTKELSLLLQEEEYEINVEVLINFESQFSGIEYEHRIKSYLPIGKILQIYHFYTFLEIPDQYLVPEMFDVNNDNIFNLHQKYDYILDKVIHCASVRYEPLIRLDSCQTSIGTSDQRSFQLQMGYTFIIPIPMYFEIPPEELPFSKEPQKIVEKNIAVPLQSSIPILRSTFHDLNKDEYYKRYIPITNIDEDNKFNQDYTFQHWLDTTSNISLSFVSGYIDTKEYQYGTVKFENVINYEGCVSSFAYFKDNIDGSKGINLKGPLFGSFTNFTMEYGFLRGFFTGTFNEVEIHKDLIGEYDVQAYLQDIVDSPKINIIEDSLDTLYTYESEMIPFGNIRYLLNEVNKNAVNFIPEESKIVGVTYVESTTNKSYSIEINDPTTRLDAYGNFQILVKHKHSILGNTSYTLVFGKINPKTIEIQYNIQEQQEGSYIVITSLNFDFSFISTPKYGARYIEKINFNIVPDDFSPITFTDVTRIKLDSFGRVLVPQDKKVLCSLIIYPSNQNPIKDLFEITDKYAVLKLQNSGGFNIKLFLEQDTVDWLLFFDNRTYNQTSNLVKLRDIQDPNLIEFEINRNLYDLHFSRCSAMNPIFLQIHKRSL